MLMLGGLAAALAKGGYDAYDASSLNNMAEIINDEAARIKGTAIVKLERAKVDCAAGLETLGRAKAEVMNTSINRFITSFEKIKIIEFRNSAGFNELRNLKFDRQDLLELRNLRNVFSSAANGILVGVPIGAVITCGAMGLVSVFGTASTGTAIGSLSGAAANNATLAWFGGGSLKAGGFGMAGGNFVLGGLAIIPPILSACSAMRSSARENLGIARVNLAKVEAFAADMEAAVVRMHAIEQRAVQFTNLLNKLNSGFVPLTYRLEYIVKNYGIDYRSYTTEQQNTIAACVAMAKAIKSVLDTPILDKDGSLTNESETILHQLNKGMY